MEGKVHKKVRLLLNSQPKIASEVVHLLEMDIENMTSSQTKKMISKIHFEITKE